MPDIVANFSTASHNSTASVPRGAFEITGPKKLASVSAPGWNVRIGVPTSLPVRLSASSVSAPMYSSWESSSAAST
jgi:hypothetical protein